MINEKQLSKIFTNPFYAINISEGLIGEHEPMVTKEEWVKVNVKRIEELGAEKWLEELLDVLEGNYVTSEDL